MTYNVKVTVKLERSNNSGFDFVEKPGVTQDKDKSKPLDTRLVKVPTLCVKIFLQ